MPNSEEVMGNFDYMNLRKAGKLSPAERFENSYIPEPNSGCWLWFGTRRDRKGYGAISINYIATFAHRFSWELHRSKIPEGICVLHKCDNPYCVNPDHLFLGTINDNNQDMVRKGRQQRSKHRRAQGENCGRSKLKAEDVLKILADGRTTRQIAAAYSTTQSNVSAIKSRKTWRSLNIQAASRALLEQS